MLNKMNRVLNRLVNKWMAYAIVSRVYRQGSITLTSVKSEADKKTTFFLSSLTKQYALDRWRTAIYLDDRSWALQAKVRVLPRFGNPIVRMTIELDRTKLTRMVNSEEELPKLWK